MLPICPWESVEAKEHTSVCLWCRRTVPFPRLRLLSLGTGKRMKPRQDMKNIAICRFKKRRIPPGLAGLMIFDV